MPVPVPTSVLLTTAHHCLSSAHHASGKSELPAMAAGGGNMEFTGTSGSCLDKASREGHRNELQVETMNHGFPKVRHEGERKIAARGTEAEGIS